jgi:hypothetical protein
MLSAPSPQTLGRTDYVLDRWSDLLGDGQPFGKECIERDRRVSFVTNMRSLKALDYVEVRILQNRHARPKWLRTEYQSSVVRFVNSH